MVKGLITRVLAAGDDVPIPTADLGFAPPEVADVITFFLRALFIIAGLVAILYLILGGLSWVTAGGNKENVDKAREKIQNAVIGLILVFAVLAVVVLLEKVLFPGACGLGISKTICVPKLIKK